MIETVGSKYHDDKDRDKIALGKNDDGSPRFVHEYWTRVYNWLVDKKTRGKLSARIRFMVTQMEELARNKWKDEEKMAKGPKTLAQIDREFKEEEETNERKRKEVSRGPVCNCSCLSKHSLF